MKKPEYIELIKRIKKNAERSDIFDDSDHLSCKLNSIADSKSFEHDTTYYMKESAVHIEGMYAAYKKLSEDIIKLIDHDCLPNIKQFDD